MNYLVLFWIVSGIIAGNYIYFKIKLSVKNPNFPDASIFVYCWMMLLGVFLGVFLFYRAQDEEWVQNLVDDLETL